MQVPQTFEWIDVENGKCTVSSSREFRYDYQNHQFQCFILDDDESVRFFAGYGIFDKNKIEETFVYPEEVEYRGKKYVVREIQEDVITEWHCGDLSKKSIVYPKALRKLDVSNELSHLELPESLEHLSLWYFKGKSLKLPASLLNIGQIYNCPNLESLEIPEGVKSIGSISKTDKWKSLVVPSSVTSIGTVRESAFRSIVFKPGSPIVKLPEYFASESKQLREVILPDHLQAVGNGAFSRCYNLTSISIPSSVKEIGGSAFEECYVLRVVNIDKDSQLEDIGWAFRYCTSLEHFEIPESMQGISAHAFEGCKSLVSVEIPNTVTSIGWYAFNGCI